MWGKQGENIHLEQKFFPIFGTFCMFDIGKFLSEQVSFDIIGRNFTVCSYLCRLSFRRPFVRKRGTSVSQLSQAVVRGLEKIYSAYYDMERFPDDGPLKARCAYHSRDSQYVLSKKVELWAAENHEYLYLWDVGRLEEGTGEEIFRTVLADGEPRVKPHSQHMSTYLTAVVLCEGAAPRAKERLKKLKKRREFKLSLHGWMEFRIAAVDLSNGEVTTNRAGKVLEKDLKRLVERIIANYKGDEKTQ